MKKILFVLTFFALSLASSAQSRTYNAYLAALDTVGAETVNHIFTVTGKKSNVSLQVDVLKISGTVAGTMNLYGSVNGTTYVTAAIASAITITDASANYAFVLTNNNYQKYKLVITTTGSTSASVRPYLLHRE